ncbi:MAG: Gfo/Idh/MocA family oxidoreductase, partial [Caldilineaceae bacterium]|nr:Gfo/Idh/MocA family oxidoreductase [Caldilineaceae bacterium]
MTNQLPIRTVMIGCGRMAQGHMRAMLAQQDTTTIGVVCEPSETAYAQTCALFSERGLTPPPNEPDLARLLNQYGAELDAAFIITP